jgi:hypothetical protein
VIRLLQRGAGLGALRIWCDGDWPTDDVPVGGIAIEWVGRGGHPTSYVLLGGSPAARFEVGAAATGTVYEDALAGVADLVRFGLPPEYRGAVDQVGELLPTGAHPCRISLAAHGEAGSSVVAFRAGTIFLTTIMGRASSLSEDELWAAWTASFDVASHPPSEP